jgi:hypothetical protein
MRVKTGTHLLFCLHALHCPKNVQIVDFLAKT